MKHLNKLSKEERIRIKGLDNFIKNADQIAETEFNRIVASAIPAPQAMTNAQIKDYGYMFRAGF